MYFAQRGWPHFMSSWLLFMLVGLSILGVWALKSGAARPGVMGPLVLATGGFGWIYHVTNSGAIWKRTTGRTWESGGCSD